MMDENHIWVTISSEWSTHIKNIVHLCDGPCLAPAGTIRPLVAADFSIADKCKALEMVTKTAEASV